MTISILTKNQPSHFNLICGTQCHKLCNFSQKYSGKGHNIKKGSPWGKDILWTYTPIQIEIWKTS